MLLEAMLYEMCFAHPGFSLYGNETCVSRKKTTIICNRPWMNRMLAVSVVMWVV